MRGYLTAEVPFGNAKTAASLIFGLADVCELMEAGQWRLAEAYVHLILAAGEQAAMQNWQWPLAWLLTQLPEPAWTRIRHQPVPETARPLSRLADQQLLSAAVAYYRDVATVMDIQRKATQGTTPTMTSTTSTTTAAHEQTTPKGKGKGRGRGQQASAAAPGDGAAVP